MPTIQLQLTDEQSEHIKAMMNEKTVSKALMFAVTELEVLRTAFTDLYHDHESLIQKRHKDQEHMQFLWNALNHFHQEGEYNHKIPKSKMEYLNPLNSKLL